MSVLCDEDKVCLSSEPIEVTFVVYEVLFIAYLGSPIFQAVFKGYKETLKKQASS